MKKRGITLIEVAAVLLIGVVLFASIANLFNRSSNLSDLQSAAGELTLVQTAVKDVFDNPPGNYTGVSASVMRGSVPVSMHGAGSTITNSFGGTITITPIPGNLNYRVEFTNVPRDVCPSFTLLDLGSELLSVGVITNTPSDPGDFVPTVVTNPATASSACRFSRNRVQFTFD